MEDFKNFLTEELAMATDLNVEYMKRTTRISAFNFEASDFKKLDYKKEIQTLYSQYIFPDFKPEMALDSIDVTKYNYLVDVLKRRPYLYNKLHNIKLSGIGPGEVVMYLLTKKAYLGGGSSAGVDLINKYDSKKYEIKAAKWQYKTKKDSVMDIKLGGNIQGISKVVTDLQNLYYQLGLSGVKNNSSIPKSQIKKMRTMEPERMQEIEKEYQKLAGNYFGNHETIFIQTEANQSDFGHILAIKQVKPEDISIERYTSNVLKPIIKIR
jgi:hypothetical protein